MTTAHLFLHNTRLMMLRRRRRVFLRLLAGGVALAATVAFCVGYFNGVAA
jgi:hypothetical protein